MSYVEDQRAKEPEDARGLPLVDVAGLRAEGYRLGVLTNCDDDLFALTKKSFLLPFDLVVTAERVRDSKPSISHCRFFARSTGAGKDNWTHIARSWHHDMPSS
jgi:2-haloacid dehalogenase